MASHQASIFIRRPLAEVFAYMDDIDREVEWQSNLVEATQSPPGPTSVGTSKQYVSQFLGKRLVNTYVVETYEPNRRMLARTTKDSVLQATSDLRWEEENGGTRVTMAVDGSASGPLRFLPKSMIEATFEREVIATLAELKKCLERGS